MNETTIFLARMMAPYLFATGIGFFLSRPFYLRMLNEADSEHPIAINLSGMVHFLIGTAVVLNHFIWGGHLEIVVTLIGIAFVLKGGILIAIPKWALKSNQVTVKKLPIVGTCFIAMSVYLAWASFSG